MSDKVVSGEAVTSEVVSGKLQLTRLETLPTNTYYNKDSKNVFEKLTTTDEQKETSGLHL